MLRKPRRNINKLFEKVLKVQEFSNLATFCLYRLQISISNSQATKFWSSCKFEQWNQTSLISYSIYFFINKNTTIINLFQISEDINNSGNTVIKKLFGYLVN